MFIYIFTIEKKIYIINKRVRIIYAFTKRLMASRNIH